MDLAFTPYRPLGPAASRSGDRYLLFLGAVLLGYALFSRSFAYVGLPPVYVGEIALVLGMVQLFRAGVWARLSGMPALWVFGVLLALTVVRTVPYVGPYGIDAPRDAMQIGYGLFALIAAGLVVKRPERIRDLVVRYRTFVVVMLALIWIVYFVGKVGGPSLPGLPWAPHVHVVEAKGGDIMVHLAGITVFLMVGLTRIRPTLAFVLAASSGLIMVSNRGGMVAYFLALAAGFVLRPPGSGKLGKLSYAFALFLVVGLMVGPIVSIHGGTRDVSVAQIWTNVKSIVGQSGSSSLEGTESWRTDWWEKIYHYTVEGPYFWTGKGFGANLATEDGFQVTEDKSLRSPHNGHMTVLARLGVPGAALWVLLQVVWGLTLLRAWWRAREARRHRWMAVFAVLVSYWLAMHINASFDVYFEGPMGGIWFWVVFGVGLGSAWAYRHSPDLLDDLDDDRPERATPPARRPAWGWPAAPRAAGPQPVPAAGWGGPGVRGGRAPA